MMAPVARSKQRCAQSARKKYSFNKVPFPHNPMFFIKQLLGSIGVIYEWQATLKVNWVCVLRAWRLESERCLLPPAAVYLP